MGGWSHALKSTFQDTSWEHRFPKEPLEELLLFCSNGQTVGQPRKRECRQNVRKMSKKCPKNVQNFCPEGPKRQFSDIFWTIFAYLVGVFAWWPCPMLARYNCCGLESPCLLMSKANANCSSLVARQARKNLDVPCPSLDGKMHV